MACLSLVEEKLLGSAQVSSFAVAPELITVQLSGVTLNDTGGHHSGDAQPTIRVINELDQTDIRSDTTLWPSGTTEVNGTSTTVVSDAELQALLDRIGIK